MSIKLLEQMGHHIDQYSINNNFIQMRTRTKYMGRWHILNVSPLTIADSAHNIDGIQYLLNYINCKNFRKIHIILGFVNDKDIHPILAILPIGAQYYYAKANIPRGLAADTLQTYAQSLGLKGRKYTNVKGAYRAAQQAATHDDLILIFGSIFIVAEVL